MTRAPQTSPPRSPTTDWLLFGGLYLFELLALLALLALYRTGPHATHLAFLQSLSGLLFLGSTLSCISLGTMLVMLAVRNSRNGSNRWLFALVTNLVVVGSVIVITEVVLRLAVTQRGIGKELNGRLLYPRQWEQVAARYQGILEQARMQPPYDVAHPLLGWTIAPSRTSANGLYKSSVEGLRSPEAGVALRSIETDCRVALLGDSFTFGEHVPYEQTWAHFLDSALGPACQVLNFGVGGYGIDQMYLRYTEEARGWSPNVVVFAFIDHDVFRALGIYSFLMFPGGAMPFTKPRFVLDNDDLRLLNLPLISSDEIFRMPSIRDLPFIEYDWEYRATEWDRPGWEWSTRLYGFRLLTSLYPLYEPARSEIASEQLFGIGRQIFRRFWGEALADGTVPLMIYLPSERDFEQAPTWDPVGVRLLRELNIPHVDLRPCMRQVGVEDMFRPPQLGGHYSEAGNRRVSTCLLDTVRAMVSTSTAAS
ncbi:hypothetical protein YTPLAS18_31460 [Nitrospira sp.]|nr:hypothetical protein YTPLAS18_31460 [Nitrospira sp.]